jgi:hypothetical protein
LNGDGFKDLCLGANRVCILFNDGDGTFVPAVEYDSGDEAQAVAAADFDLDGDIDLVNSNRGGTISYYENDGSGTLMEPVFYDAGIYPNT